jgi:hypothetical protein
VPKWQIPDDVAFVDELPHTATGKLQKLRLREQFRDHVLPGREGDGVAWATPNPRVGLDGGRRECLYRPRVMNTGSGLKT